MLRAARGLHAAVEKVAGATGCHPPEFAGRRRAPVSWEHTADMLESEVGRVSEWFTNAAARLDAALARDESVTKQLRNATEEAELTVARQVKAHRLVTERLQREVAAANERAVTAESMVKRQTEAAEAAAAAANRELVGLRSGMARNTEQLARRTLQCRVLIVALRDRRRVAAELLFQKQYLVWAAGTASPTASIDNDKERNSVVQRLEEAVSAAGFDLSAPTAPITESTPIRPSSHSRNLDTTFTVDDSHASSLPRPCRPTLRVILLVVRAGIRISRQGSRVVWPTPLPGSPGKKRGPPPDLSATEATCVDAIFRATRQVGPGRQCAIDAALATESGCFAVAVWQGARRRGGYDDRSLGRSRQGRKTAVAADARLSRLCDTVATAGSVFRLRSEEASSLADSVLALTTAQHEARRAAAESATTLEAQAAELNVARAELSNLAAAQEGMVPKATLEEAVAASAELRSRADEGAHLAAILPRQVAMIEAQAKEIERSREHTRTIAAQHEALHRTAMSIEQQHQKLTIEHQVKVDELQQAEAKIAELTRVIADVDGWVNESSFKDQQRIDSVVSAVAGKRSQQRSSELGRNFLSSFDGM